MSKNKLLDKFEIVEKLVDKKENNGSVDSLRTKWLNIAKTVIKQKNDYKDEVVDYSNVLKFEPRKKQK